MPERLGLRGLAAKLVRWSLLASTTLLIQVSISVPSTLANFITRCGCPDELNYAILYEGGGGRLDFAAPNTGHDKMNGATGPSPITFGVAQVQTDLNLINALLAILGAKPG